MMLSDLEDAERLVLGALVRLIVRADGEFSTEEEERIDRIGDELGSRDGLWKAISDSAQAIPDERRVLGAAAQVRRAEARELILGVIAGVAAADTISPAEMGVIDAVRAAWAKADGHSPG